MTTKKNIVVISHMYPRKNRSNYGTFICEQVKALKDTGKFANISVISPVQYAPAPLARFSKKWSQYRNTEKARTDFGQVKVFFPRYICPPRKALRSLAAGSCYTSLMKSKEIASVLKKADIIIAHTALFDGRLAKIISTRLGKSYWVYIHGEDIFQNTYGPRNTIKKFNIKKVLQASRGIITVSQKMKEKIGSSYGVEEKTFVNHNGVDLAVFSPRGDKSTERLRIITAAFLIPRKGHRYVLEALAKIKARGLDFNYEIASDGPERAHLEELTHSLGLDDAVKFSGFYEHANFPKLLEDNGLFLLPSWDEAFGVVYVEAMAMGLPVIAANDAGANDIVTDGVDGFLVPPKDSDAIADAIMKYHRLTKDQKVKMAEMAIKKAQSFSWRSNAERLVSLVGVDHE